MKTTLTAVAFVAAFCSLGQSAKAQSMTIDVADYAVYFAEPPATGWFIDWIDDNGESVGLQGPYTSPESAQERVTWAFLGGHERTNNVEIVELPIPTQWVYFETFDTISEAAAVANFFSDLGLQSDIRRIAKYDLRANVYQQLHYTFRY
jgi:hypothetical protein